MYKDIVKHPLLKQQDGHIVSLINTDYILRTYCIDNYTKQYKQLESIFGHENEFVYMFFYRYLGDLDIMDSSFMLVHRIEEKQTAKLNERFKSKYTDILIKFRTEEQFLLAKILLNV